MENSRIPTAFVLALLATACPAQTDGTGTGETGDTNSTQPTGSGGSEEKFGFVCIDLVRADGEAGDPFAGTAKIAATLDYEACLIKYYTEKHVEQALGGAEAEATFSEWKNRLCSESVSRPLVACEVEDFSQILMESDTVPSHEMTVTYAVLDASQIDGRTLLWGPAPLLAHAECDMEQQPEVRMMLPSSLVGFDANGVKIWSTAVPTLEEQRGVVQLDNTDCIPAKISRNAGT